jgi:hypothetical protein
MYVFDLGDRCHQYDDTKCPMYRSPKGPFEYRVNITGTLPLMPATLTYLRLDNIKLHGPIPLQWCNMKGLQDLRLRMTDVSGPLPPCMNKMVNLKRLTIADNRYMNGVIPWKGITQIMSESIIGKPGSGIQDILITNSHFEGRGFPNEFPSNCSLIKYIIGGKELNGTIPPSIVNCKRLQALHIGDDMLAGGTNGEISCLNCLGTSISGTIPNGLCDQLCDLTSFEYSSATSIFIPWNNMLKQKRSDIDDTSFRNYCTLEKWENCISKDKCINALTAGRCANCFGCTWVTSTSRCERARTADNYPFK